jgi:hypothetical protein
MGKYTDEPRLHPASDDKNVNCKLQVRVSPDWLHQIDVIVKNKHFPYVNRGELVRDAIYRHILWLDKIHIPFGSIAQKIQSMADLLEEAKIQQGFESVIDNLQERVAYFGRKGARNEAVKCVLKILGYIDEMPDGHWKDTFRDEIKEKYSGLLQCAPKANLRKGSEE